MILLKDETQKNNYKLSHIHIYLRVTINFFINYKE